MTWPTLASTDVLADVRGRVVLLDGETQILHVLDPSAGFVVQHRHQFEDLDDAAREISHLFGPDVTTVRRDLSELDALLTQRERPASMGLPSTFSQRSAPRDRPGARWLIDALGSSIEVRCHDQSSAVALDPVLKVHRTATMPAAHLIEVWVEDGGIVVTVDGDTLCEGGDLALAISRVVAAITVIATEAATVRPLVHAAGVEFDGQGLILAGASNAGKSSTTVELMRGGAGYLTDEVLEVNPVTATMRGLARPIGLEGEIRHAHPDLRPNWWDPTQLDRWPTPPQLLGPVVDEATVSTVVFLDFEVSCAPEVIALPPLAALGRLVAAVCNPSTLNASMLESLGDLLHTVPAFVVRHHGAPNARDLILEKVLTSNELRS